MKLNDLIKIGINCIYGTAGSGRSCLCLTTLVEILNSNGKVIYLDTENSFSIERFKQIAGSDYEKLLENLFIFKIKSFKEQQLRVKELKNIINKSKVSLIVIDSISYFYRRLVNRERELAKSMLVSQLRLLKELKIPILITCETFTNIETKLVKAVGHEILRKHCNMIYLRKSRNEIILANREKYNYEILSSGIRII